MKKVMIVFGKSRWSKSRPFDNPKYMYSYEYFYDLCKQNGIQMYRASYQWYDYRKKYFKYAWAFEGKGAKWERVYDIRPDLVYDKTKALQETYYRADLIGRDYKFFNNLEFSKIIDNKLNVSLLFPEWSRKNVVVETRDEVRRALEQISGERIVLKPMNLSGGENVFIETKDTVMETLDGQKIEPRNWIMQEFIDSSGGIPGIVDGIHDLRLVLVNDKISYSYYRKPAEGNLLANIAQGGKLEMVPVEKLPSSVWPIVEKANELFSPFRSKLYTIDLMFDKKERPWIVELNSMPGMYFEPGHADTKEKLYRDLLEIFKTELEMN